MIERDEEGKATPGRRARSGGPDEIRRWPRDPCCRQALHPIVEYGYLLCLTSGTKVERFLGLALDRKTHNDSSLNASPNRRLDPIAVR